MTSLVARWSILACIALAYNHDAECVTRQKPN